MFISLNEYVFVKVTPYEENARTRSLVLYANGTSCPYVQDSTAGKLNPGHLKERNFGKLNSIKIPIVSIKNDDLRYIFHLVVCLYFH